MPKQLELDEGAPTTSEPIFCAGIILAALEVQKQSLESSLLVALQQYDLRDGRLPDHFQGRVFQYNASVESFRDICLQAGVVLPERVNPLEMLQTFAAKLRIQQGQMGLMNNLGHSR